MYLRIQSPLRIMFNLFVFLPCLPRPCLPGPDLGTLTAERTLQVCMSVVRQGRDSICVRLSTLKVLIEHRKLKISSQNAMTNEVIEDKKISGLCSQSHSYC